MGMFLNVCTLVVGTAGAVGKNGTAYSVSKRFKYASGHATVLLITTAGSITVTQQCSLDDTNWYDPVDSDGNALGQVTAGQTVTTGVYINYDPVLAPYMRFKVVEANVAATVVTLKPVYQEEV